MTPLKTNKEKILDISMQSASAKEKKVYIFELGEMSDFLGETDSERVRQSFLDNGVGIQQITNDSTIPEFSGNSEFVNALMQFRYVGKDLFDIRKEILIFDNVVAIYNYEEIIVIEDQDFAAAQKQLFQSIWKEGISPKVDFPYVPNHSFYNSVDIDIQGTQMIVWPDADAVESYKGYDKDMLQRELSCIIERDIEYYGDSSYIIAFIWSLDGVRMVDIWKFEDNTVDGRSGPLSEVRVYKEQIECSNIGLARGGTLLVLGYEEKLRRQANSLSNYLDGPAPELPLEITNKLDFFDYNNSK